MSQASMLRMATLSAIVLSTGIVSACSDRAGMFARRTAAEPYSAGAGSTTNLAQAAIPQRRQTPILTGGNQFVTGDIKAGRSATTARREVGVAQWDGSQAAIGMTANHPSLPRYSWARVTNLQTNRSTLVKIISNNPTRNGSAIELSRDAAAEVGALQGGATRVSILPADPHRAVTPRRQVASALPKKVEKVATVTAPAPRTNKTFQAQGPQMLTGSIPRNRTASAPRAYVPSYVQVGSFSNRQNAEKALFRLKTRALDPSGPFIQEANVNGRTYYRVRLGPLASAGEAQRALAAAKSQGYGDARLLTK